MKNNSDWKPVSNGLSKLSDLWFYEGQYKDILGAKVFFKDGKWVYRIYEKGVSSASEQRIWTNRGSGWKNIKTALFKAGLGVGDVAFQLNPELFND